MTTGELSCTYRGLDSLQFIVNNLRPFPLPRAIESAQKGGTNIGRKRTATYCDYIQGTNPSSRVCSLIAGNTGMTWYPTEHDGMAVL
jgi:hypothetical protein